MLLLLVEPILAATAGKDPKKCRKETKIYTNRINKFIWTAAQRSADAAAATDPEKELLMLMLMPKRILQHHESHLEGATTDASPSATKHQKKRAKAEGGQINPAPRTASSSRCFSVLERFHLRRNLSKTESSDLQLLPLQTTILSS